MTDVLVSIAACCASLAAGVFFADKIKALFKAKVAEAQSAVEAKVTEVTEDIKAKL